MKKKEIIIIAVIVLVLAVFTGYSVNTIGADPLPKKTCHRELVRSISSNHDSISIPDGWEPFVIGNELWFKRTVCN